MPKTVDFYAVLELPRTATSSDITKAYRKLAMKWHPDKNANRKEEATEKFKSIAEAYEVLSDSKKKEFYDRHGFLPGDTTQPTYSEDQSRHAFDIFEEFFKRDPILQGFFGRGFSGSRRSGRSSVFDSFFDDDTFGDDMFGRARMGGMRGMGGIGGMGGMGFSDSSFGGNSSFFSSVSSSGGVGKSVSTSTRTVNGRTVTTTEEVIRHPDGRVESRTVTSNEDHRGSLGDRQPRSFQSLPR
ncbi:DnaJ domain-containing protein [Cardiosporidium cionae]|uniref:DnaJ domain-containing protein n=1 Tax=Cardiosporidium cionae TaxID=476202 RepID=A0ABQ7JDS0_9APIC|nr:DnaJ domain-containing protein [Cardiosporidium cionae]|eukprot:KAF8822116.1 DnaJ domain-containing protein [Cardiosporidium cionae]